MNSLSKFALIFLLLILALMGLGLFIRARNNKLKLVGGVMAGSGLVAMVMFFSH